MPPRPEEDEPVGVEAHEFERTGKGRLVERNQARPDQDENREAKG